MTDKRGFVLGNHYYGFRYTFEGMKPGFYANWEYDRYDIDLVEYSSVHAYRIIKQLREKYNSDDIEVRRLVRAPDGRISAMPKWAGLRGADDKMWTLVNKDDELLYDTADGARFVADGEMQATDIVHMSRPTAYHAAKEYPYHVRPIEIEIDAKNNTYTVVSRPAKRGVGILNVLKEALEDEGSDE